jgi:hypothetical protein
LLIVDHLCFTNFSDCLEVLKHQLIVNQLKKKTQSLSPPVNYTDQATDVCWRSDCQLFADKGFVWSACNILMVRGKNWLPCDHLFEGKYFKVFSSGAFIHKQL